MSLDSHLPLPKYLEVLHKSSSIFFEDFGILDNIAKVLEIAGEASGVDNIRIFANTSESPSAKAFYLYAEWHNQQADTAGIEFSTPDYQWDNFSDLYNRLQQKSAFVCSKDEIAATAAFLNSVNNAVHQSFVYPLFFSHRFWGFICISSFLEQPMTPTEITFFTTFCAQIGLYLKQINLEGKLYNYHNFIETNFKKDETLQLQDGASYQNRHIEDLKKLALIAQKSQTVVMLCNDNHTIKWVNEAFTQTFGYTLGEVEGKIPAEILSGPETDLEALANIKEQMNKGVFTKFEVLNYTKSGQKVWVLTDITPLRNQSNELLAYIIIETNISDKKRAESEIQEAIEKEKRLNILKSKFVSLASHEFRTPLAGIQISADIIQLLVGRLNVVDAEVKAKLDKHVGRISSEIFRMAEIMNNVLLMGKIDADRVQFFPAENDLVEFVHDCLSQLYVEGVEDCPIALDISGTPRKFLFDKALMEHIVKNLISNALKYSEGQQRPIIRIVYHQLNVSFSIQDFGIGIPDEDKPYIFQSFFRASNTDAIQGIGLGMVIIKQFIELHNGTITFESELNKGTTFTFKLPLDFK